MKEHTPTNDTGLKRLTDQEARENMREAYTADGRFRSLSERAEAKAVTGGGNAPRTNFRGELITNEPDILNRLMARAKRAEAQRGELLTDMVKIRNATWGGKRTQIEKLSFVYETAKAAIAKIEGRTQ